MPTNIADPISHINIVLIISGFQNKHFSMRHKIQFFCPGLYLLHLYIISQCTSDLRFKLYFQTKDASVEFYFQGVKTEIKQFYY